MKTSLTTIGARIKDVRILLGKNQDEFGLLLGVGKSAVSKYENGDADPGAVALSIIAKAGDVSLDWLISGQGPGPGEGHSITKEQLSHYIHGTEEPPKGLTMADAAIMRAVIEGIEEHLAAQELELRPEKKADLVLTLFEMCIEEGKQVDKATIIRLVKLAA